MPISIFKNSRSQILNITLATTLPFVASALEAEEQVLQEVLPSSQQESKERPDSPPIQLQEILPSSQQELQEKPISPPIQLQEPPIKPKKTTPKKTTVIKKNQQRTKPNPAIPIHKPESISVEDIIDRVQGKQTSSVSDSHQYTDLNTSTTDSQMANLLSNLGMTTTPEIVSGSDPNSVKQAISRLEATYGLSPEILNLQDQLPPDPESVIRQLNLQPPTPATNRTDLSDHTPTVEEIIQALQLR